MSLNTEAMSGKEEGMMPSDDSKGTALPLDAIAPVEPEIMNDEWDDIYSPHMAKQPAKVSDDWESPPECEPQLDIAQPGPQAEEEGPSGSTTVTENQPDANRTAPEPDDVLIPINSARNSAFLGPKPVLVNFIDGDKFLPSSQVFVHTGPNVKLQLEGSPMAPKLKFTMTVVNKTETSLANTLHQAILEFGFFSKDEVINFTYKTQFTEKKQSPKWTKPKKGKQRRKEVESEKYTHPCAIILTFRTRGGVGYRLRSEPGVFEVLGDKITSVLDLLTFMSSFTKCDTFKAFSCKLIISPEQADQFDSGELLKTTFDEMKNCSTSLPWAAYRGRQQTIITQFGVMRPRLKVWESWGSNGIIQVPSENYFHDLDEVRVKLCYGAKLEFDFQLIHLKRLMDVKHEVTFVNFGETMEQVIAVIKFSSNLNERFTPQKIMSLHALVREGTFCTLEFKDGQSEEAKTCSGRTFLNVFALPFQSDLIVSLPGRKPKGLKNCLHQYPPPEKPNWYSCTLTFRLIDKCVKSQIKAVNNMCSTELRKWHGVLMNHNLYSLPRVNTFEGISDAELKVAYDEIMALKPWNGPQVQCFTFLKGLPSSFGVIEGIFGCGKTTVQAAMAILCVKLNFDVLIVAHSNAALQALEEKLRELNNNETIPVMRVLQSSVEYRNAFLAKNPDDSANDGDADEDEDSSHDAFVDIIRGINRARTSRFDVLPSHAMHQQVYELATRMQSSDQKLLFIYKKYQQQQPSKKRSPCQNPDSGVEDIIMPADLSESEADDVPTTQEQTEQLDAVQIYMDYINKYVRNKDERTDEKRQRTPAEIHAFRVEKRQFSRAVNELSNKAVRDVRVLLCTNQVADSNLVKEFGSVMQNGAYKSRGIVIISDEDGQCLETDAWIPVSALTRRADIKAIIRFGDRLQLPPVVMSLGREPHNEFAPQIARSLFDRTLRSAENKIYLNIQHRMRKELADFPNRFTYGGKLRNAASTENLVIPPTFDRGLCAWIESNYPTFVISGLSRHLLGIDVPGECIIDGASNSRYNELNVEAVVSLVEAVLQKGSIDGWSMTIIVPYAAQRVHYVHKLHELQERLGITYESLPKVLTIDSSQGHESDVVIMDWVVTCSDMRSDIGFLSDNRRVNVAITRARSCLISVGCSELAFGKLSGRKVDDQAEFGFYEIVEHWKYLLVKDVVVAQKETEPVETQINENVPDDSDRFVSPTCDEEEPTSGPWSPPQGSDLVNWD